MADFSVTYSWRKDGEVSQSTTKTYSVDTIGPGVPVSFTASGQVIGRDDELPSLNKLAFFGIRFPADSKHVALELKTHASGSYLSGGIIDTFTFTSGRGVQTWEASGMISNPFRHLSGTITAQSWTCTYLASGQTVSGRQWMGFYN